MSFRFMRIIVMFDLPSITSSEKAAYRQFRKYLLSTGFLMLQESIYAKLALNQVSSELIMQGVRRNKPPEGSLFMLTVTEKQFAKMEILVGERVSEVLNSTDRTVVL